MEFILLIGQLALMGAICYFLLIRPENKKRKTLNELQSNLNKGDRVVTTGGLRARVHAFDETTVTLITDDGVKLHFERQAIIKKI